MHTFKQKARVKEFYEISERFPRAATSPSNITLVILHAHGCDQPAAYSPLDSVPPAASPPPWKLLCSLLSAHDRSHSPLHRPVLHAVRWFSFPPYPVNASPRQTSRRCYSCRASPLTQLRCVAMLPYALSHRCRKLATWFLVQLVAKNNALKKLSKARTVQNQFKIVAFSNSTINTSIVMFRFILRIKELISYLTDMQ